MAFIEIEPIKLGKAYRYSNLLRTAPERDYANSYICWLRNGAMGLEPERGRLTIKAALAIRNEIDAMKLWGV